MSKPSFEVRPDSLVWDHFRRHALEMPEREAVVHVEVDRPPYRWRWGELLRAASTVARRLANEGVREGEVCALIIRHHPFFYPVYLGISALGALPAVLAYPNARLHADKFREGLRGMAERSGLDHILTEHDLEAQVRPLVGTSATTVKDVLFPLEWLADPSSWERSVAEHPASDADAPCLLQHSSGTTGLQKPVVLSHRAILEHARSYGEAIALRPEDRVVTWLPLYHDMGLIAAYYLPLVHGIPVVQLSPMEWVASPVLLLQALSGEGGTLSWLPNFAYNLIADRVRDEDLTGIRLDGVRLLVNCSEPVRGESQERFARRLAPLGLRREALGACYAMAETTFGASQTPPGARAREITVDREALAGGRVVSVAEGMRGRICVSSGMPISGCRIRIVDEQRRDQPAGIVGEIAISSTSMFSGYRNYPEKTSAVLEKGWYYSGDYGFLHCGECFVIGRKKDVIIVAGNNIYPEDIEDEMGKVPGVIPGRVVAFGLEDERIGSEVVCILAETEAADPTARKALRLRIVEAAMGIDVTVARVYLVPPRWMIKSSAGKPARSTNRARVTPEMTRG